MKLILSSLLIAAVLAVVSAENAVNYPSARQGRSKFNPDEIISDRKRVLDALKCIRGESCPFPRKYSKLLKEAGPTLMVYGYCPSGTCTYEDENKAKDLLHRISVRYPKAFYYTYNEVRAQFE